jgi:hypothetical protein
MRNTYAEVARDLREIADRLDALGDREMPGISYATVGLQVADREPDDTIIATVSQVTAALTGATCETWSAPSGSTYHSSRGRLGGVQVSVSQVLAGTKLREPAGGAR